MKKYQIKFSWEIRDTRDLTGCFRTGESSMIIKASLEEAMTAVIEFAQHLPNYELERNNIDVNEYREGNVCRYYYSTMISKILEIKIIK